MTVSLSEERAQLVRQRILTGAVTQLRAGRGWTFAAVAEAAAVPERTVYRYFPSREALLQALFEHVNAQIGLAHALPTDAAALVALARRAFVAFDEMSPVVHELLSAPEGKQARLRDNAARQRAALSLVRASAPGLDSVAARRLAAIHQLLVSASTWRALADYWGMDGREAAEAVALAVSLLGRGARAAVRAKKPKEPRKPKTQRRRGAARKEAT